MLLMCIKYLKSAESTTPEFRQSFRDAFKTHIEIVMPRSRQKTPLDECFEDGVKIPTTYEGLIAIAESGIPQDELRRKYEPPAKPYPKPIQY